MSKILSFILKILNVIFVSLTLALLFVSIFRADLIKDFLWWIEQTIKILWNRNYLIAFTSATIESFPVIGVLVPWMQVMLAVGGFFWKNNLVGVISVSIVWAIIGNYIGYLLGIKYWNVFFAKYWDYFWIGKTELKILKKQIEKNWPWFIIFGKFHNLTRAFIPFIAWSAWMIKKNFWFYNIIGSIIWAFTIIFCWIVFANFYKHIIDNMTYILLWITIIVATYIYFFKKKEFLEYIKEKNAEIDQKIK